VGGTLVISLAIVDDQDLVRDGLRALFENHPLIQVVGEAADGEAAISLCREHRPTVVLMDIRMPVMDGLGATARIVEEGTAGFVVLLTTFELDDYVLAGLRAGASGFLLKDATRERIVEAVERVAAGEAQLAPSVTRSLVDRILAAPLPPRRSDLPVLTPRESEVLLLVARGLSNAEIAAELFLGVATVKAYASSLFEKLGVRDRVQATVLAYESGRVHPGMAPTT
jgi:DNA-binding NarL/FixJ family response regulator